MTKQELLDSLTAMGFDSSSKKISKAELGGLRDIVEQLFPAETSYYSISDYTHQNYVIDASQIALSFEPIEGKTIAIGDSTWEPWPYRMATIKLRFSMSSVPNTVSTYGYVKLIQNFYKPNAFGLTDNDVLTVSNVECNAVFIGSTYKSMTGFNYPVGYAINANHLDMYFYDNTSIRSGTYNCIGRTLRIK